MPFPSLTLEQLQAACAEWQKRLRLQDWDVDLKIMRGFEFDAQADITLDIPNHCATLRIRDGSDAPPRLASDDMESNLLHELLHLRLAGVGKNMKNWYEGYEADESVDQMRATFEEHALCGLVPYMMSVGRVIPLEAAQ